MQPRARAQCLMIVALGSVVTLAGCLSQPINKRDAGELVRASTAFTRPKFAHIPRFITFRGYTYGSNGVLSINDLAQLDPTLAILKLQRVVSVNESMYGTGPETMHQLVVTPVAIDSASLTADEDPRSGAFDQQQELDAQEERRRSFTQASYYSSFKREIGWRIPIGTRQFLEVRQIHNWRDANENIPVNELAVDFTWRWVPNEFGDAFDTESDAFRSFPEPVQKAAESYGIRMNTEATMLSRAYLRREGKQWQLSVIQWSFGRGNPR